MYSPPHDVHALHMVEDWLARLTYKPGTMMTAQHSYSGDVVVHLTGSLFNTYSGDEVIVRLEDGRSPSGEYIGSMRGPMVKISATFTVPHFFMSDDLYGEFLRWLRGQLHEWELHESDEWLKEKGNPRPLFDPHAVV